MYEQDKRVVLTLDAGGTNFVFSALQGGLEIVNPICFPAEIDDLDKCLSMLIEGFTAVKSLLKEMPVAISFAFPGPADYENGVIGDLPNLPAFRGGVALGPLLKKKFGIPVFINNDGSLFAYGEALAGILPEINEELQVAGNSKRYKNLLGVTLGTGFGAGVVINNRLLDGDNGSGGDVWTFRGKRHTDLIAEEGVSIRAVKRVYCELSGEAADELTPKDIFEIAEGNKPGNRQAAIDCFAMLGEMAGDVISHALTLIDGLVVIGGGMSAAAKYILPALLQEMNATIGMSSGQRIPRLQMKAFNLTDERQMNEFLSIKPDEIFVPILADKVVYNRIKTTGVAISKLGTNRAIALGAYAFALFRLDEK